MNVGGDTERKETEEKAHICETISRKSNVALTI